jgi:hypothetical protein
MILRYWILPYYLHLTQITTVNKHTGFYMLVTSESMTSLDKMISSDPLENRGRGDKIIYTYEHIERAESTNK